MGLATGIIAEYNPFHNGHAYQLLEAKRLTGARFAVVAMSGSFTQRGEVACADRFTRARFALMGGVDLVLELPLLFALAPAERFAAGGVRLLASTGLADTLSFGAETADMALLRASSRAVPENSAALKEALSKALAKGLPFPSARTAALSSCGYPKKVIDTLSSPNNILAVEYIRAIDKYSPNIQPAAVLRQGAAHDAAGYANGFASASALRFALEERNYDMLLRCVPHDEADECIRLVSELAMPCSAARLSDALIYALRRYTADELCDLADVGEGLENVIYRAARECTTLAQLTAAIKTKRYTLARIRRIFAFALLGITKSVQARFPAPLYIRVLGVRREAKELLSALSERSSLPVVTSRADRDALDAEARAMLDFDTFAAEVLSMASPEPSKATDGFTNPLICV